MKRRRRRINNYTTEHHWRMNVINWTKRNRMTTSCLAYSSTLKMAAVYPSKTSMSFYRTTRSHVPEDGTLITVYVSSKSDNLRDWRILLPFCGSDKSTFKQRAMWGQNSYFYILNDTYYSVQRINRTEQISLHTHTRTQVCSTQLARVTLKK
jgi:hypothetical protein